MTQYILQSLNIKTNAVTKKALVASGKGSVKAQFGTQYLVVDAETGRAPKKQVLRKKGKDLIIEVDGVQVGIIRGFYEDAANKEAPTYRVDDFCSLDDAKSLEASNKEGKYELVVGGTGEGSAYAAGDGIVWHEDASKCIYQPTDPAELAATASEGLTQQQLLLGGLGALLVGGGAVAIGSSSGGGGSSASTPPPAAPQLTNVADDVPGIVGNLQSGALTNDNKPTLTFTAQPGSTVNIYDNGVLLGVAIEGPAGIFTLTPGAALADGVHSFTATATNAGGTSAPTAAFTLNIDTIGGGSLPGLNIPDAPLGVNNTEAVNGVKLVITLPPDAVAGEVVTSVITDPNGRVITLTTTLTEADVTAGTITQTVPLTDLKPGTAYLDGRWDTSTTVGDLAGNTGPAQIGSFNLAANAPSLSLNTIAGDNIVNAVEKQGAVAVTGSTSAEPGQTVTITVTGPSNTSLTYYAAVQPDGTFSTDIPATIMAGLQDGTYTLTANVSNAAGTPAVAASKTLAIDTVAPTVTITHVAGADNVFDAAERGYDATTNTLSSTVPTPPTISGTTDAEPGQTVTVLIDGQSYNATVVAGAGGVNTWSVQVSQATAAALIHGTTYPVSASVNDIAGNISTPDTEDLSVNIAPPDVPTVNQNLSGTATPTVTGLAQKLDGSNNPIPLTNGDVLTFTLNGVTVTATIDSTSGTGTNNPGVVYDAATKTWSLNTLTVEGLNAQNNPVTGITLTNGTYNVGVSVATGGSQTGRSDISIGELVINTVPPAITLNAVSPDASGQSLINGAEQNQAVTLTGTTNAEPGQTVIITGLGNSTYTAVVQAGANGLNTFSVQVPGSDIAQLGDGTLQLQASVTNRFGLSGNDTEAVLVDTTAPSAPAVAHAESPLGVSAAEAASSGGTPLVLTLPTNAQVGDVVTSVITKPDGSILTLTHTILASELPAAQGGTATGSGPFTITQNIPTAQLNVDGTWSTSTTITDTNGNTSQPGTGNFVLDTQGPGQPAVALPEATNGVNAAEAASLGGTPLVVTLPTNAAVGDTVTSIITKPDGSTLTLTSVLTAADISAGSVSQLIPTSALTVDGAWTTSTTIADIAGNASPARAGGFTLDTTPPAAPVADVAAASDTGVSNTDNKTSDTTPTISGTGTAGDTITVTMPATTAFTNGEVLTVVVASDGTWSVTPTGALADGLHNVLVTATDPAGNTSPATTVPVRIDTSAPATPAAPDLVASSDTGNSSTDNSTADNTPTFSGTGTAGDTITVYDGNTVLGTAVVDGNGNWSLTAPASMADGVHQITTTASDPAGNTSGRSPALAVTIDTQAPAAPAAALHVDSNSGSTADNITNDNTPTITGTGTDGDTITLKDAAGNIIGTAVVSGGSWSITPANPLADGLQNFAVTATDPAGNTSLPTTVPVVIDTTPPAAPAAALATGSNSGSTSDNITKDNTPEITGTGATPGDTITLYAPNGTTVLGTAVVAAGGTWSITPSNTTAYPNGLPDGLNNLSVKATDPAGNVSAATPVPVVIDTTVAAPVISPTNGAVISGTGEPGATVTLTDGTNTVGTAVVAADGTWSITPASGTPVADGKELTATQTDVASNLSVPSAPVTVDSSMPQINPTNGALIKGTGAPGHQIELKDANGNPILDASNQPLVVTVAADGTWTATPGTQLAGGTVVVAKDLTSNLTDSETVDRTPPNVPTLDLTAASDTGISSTDDETSDNTPTVSGTGTPGSTIKVYDGTTRVGTAIVAADGTWTATLSSLTEGVHNLTATATDAAGNTSAASTALPVTIDTLAPSAPAADVATTSDTGADNTDNITKDNTPTITGTGTDGDTITLKDANGNVLGTTVVASDGTWSITPTNALPDGTQTLKVTATDPAGNTSSATDVPVTIDTIAPVAPTGYLASSSNSGLTTDNITRVTTPTISGVGGTPGHSIKLYDVDGTTVLGTGVVAADGTWSVTPTTAFTSDGLKNLQISATDPAGNESAKSVVPVVIDTTAPLAPAADVAASSDTGSSNTDNITSDNTPTITGGGATPGDTITLNGPNGTSLGTAVVAADGTWSITPTTTLADGAQTLTVTATDPQGNTGPATNVPVTIDTSAGTPTGALASASDTGTQGDNLTKDNTPAISGTADANAAISVVINGLTYTTTANSSGAWSIDLQTATPVGGTGPAPALADGTYTPVITATDPAGNSITTNGTPFKVDATAPAAPVINPTNGELITGTGEPGATVTLKGAANNVIGTAVVAADGTWAITPATPVANGTVLNATQSDPAGNVSPTDTETVDTSLPDAPVIEQANASTISGTGAPGATIALTLVDSTGAVIGILRDANGAPLTVTVAQNGTWSASPAAALADGATVKATQTITHNGSPFTAYDTDIVDAMPPAAPAADIVATSDTGSSNTDNITSNTQPEISGAGATPGDTITLKAANGTVLGHATVAADGSWAITPLLPLAQGTQNLSVTATDPSGNVSPATLVPVTIDTGIANPTGGLASASDTGTVGDNKTNDTTPALSGVAELGAAVEVTVNGVVYTTTADPTTGAWSIPATNTLANGTYTPSIKVTDAAGNTVTTNGTTFTVDATAPATPTLTSVYDDIAGGAYNATTTNNLTNGGITNDAKPTLTFTAEAGSTVKVYDGNTLLGTATEGPAGTFTFTPTTALSEGAHSFTATATDAAGNLSPSTTPFTTTIDNLAPSVPGALSVPENSNGGVNAAEVISGGGVPVSVPLTTTGANAVQAGDVITLTVDDPTSNAPITLSYTITAADITAGTASVLIPSSDIPAGTAGDGLYGVKATITDAAGNVSGQSTSNFTVDQTAPAPGTGRLDAASDTLNSTARDDITKDNTPILSGNAEAGSTVEVTVNGKTYPATLNGTTWTLEIPAGASLPDGSYTPSIKVTDAAGNSTTSTGTAFVVDTSAPTAPAAALAVGSNSGLTTDNITKDNTPEITGTGATPGDTITLYDADGTTVLGTAVVAAGGTWSITPTTALADGPQALSVKATDPAGNVSPATPLPLVIDTAVAAPVISPTNGAVISGTGEPGATVTLTDGTNTVGTAVVAADGTWSITPASGTPVTNGKVLTATQTDVASNLSVPSAPVTVDSSMPQINPTNGALITGTGAPGQTLALSFNGAPILDSANQQIIVTVGSNGTWSTLGTTIGTALVTGNQVVATDTTNSQKTANALVDATAPNAPAAALADSSNSGSLADTLTNDNTPTISGTGATPGETITLKSPTGTVLGTAVVAANGTWAITPTATLADGAYTGANALQVTATDKAGNTSQPTSVPVTIDTQGPSAPATAPDMTAGTDTGSSNTDNNTANPKPAFTIGALPEGTVSAVLFVGGVAVPATYDAATGTLTPNTPLVDGPHAITYAYTDAAGNAGTPSTALPIVIDTTAPTAPAAPDLQTASDTGSSNTDNTTSDTTPTFDTGVTGAANVVLLVDGAPVAATYDATTGALTPTSPLSEGTHDIAIQVVDLAGNTSPASTALPVTIDTTAPAAPTSAPDMTEATDKGTSSTDNLTKDNTPDFNIGVVPAGSTPVLLVDGVKVPATVSTDGSGNTILSPTTALSDRPHTISYAYEDLAGNTSAAGPALSVNIDTGKPSAPTGTLADSSNSGSLLDTITNDPTPTITGTGTNGETITLYADDGTTVLGTAVVANGTWSITPANSTGLNLNGLNNLQISSTDAAGNESDKTTVPVTIDTTAPTAPVVNSQSTSDITPIITGTTGTSAALAAGETMAVTVNGATYSVVPGSGGTWSLDLGTATPTSGTLGAFPDGTYQVAAAVTDAAGNRVTETTSNELVINTAVMSVDFTTSSGSIVTDGTTLHTNDTTPVITGKVTSTVDVTNTPVKVDVVVNGVTLTYTVLPNAQGVFSIDTATAVPTSSSSTTVTTFPTVSNASIAVTATVLSATGIPETATETINIDTTAPLITITSVAGDSVGASDNGTFDLTERGFTLDANATNGFTFNTSVTTPPVISGTTDAADGRTVTVTLNGKTYTTTASGGTWSVTATEADAKLLNHGSTYTLTASVTDLAGNTGTDVNNGLTVSIAPPDVPTVVSQTTADLTPVITGVAMKLDTMSTQTPLPGIPLDNRDSFTVTLNGHSYSYTVGGAATQNGLTYNTTTGAWSLAVPAGVLTAPTTVPLTYNVDVSSTAGGLTRSDISSGELVIVAPPSIVTEPTGQSWTNEVWGSTSSGGALLNVGEASDGTTVRVNINGTGAQAGQVVSVQWDTQTATESPLLTAANIAAGYIDVLVPKATLQAATAANIRETLNVTPKLLSGPGGSTISTGAAVQATVDFIVPAAPAIHGTTGSTTSALTGIQEALYDKNLAAFQTNSTTLSSYGKDNALYYSEFWNGGNSPGTVVRIQLPMTASPVDARPVAGDTLTINWGNQSWVVGTALTATDINNKYVDVIVPDTTIAKAGYGTISVNATITSARSGNTSTTIPIDVKVVYDQPLFDLARNADGFQIDGRSASEFTGQKLVTVGDVNGDGYDDIGVMGQLANGTQAAYVVYGKPGVGEVDLSSFTGVSNTEGFMVVAPGTRWNTFTYTNQPTWTVPYLSVGVEIYGGGDVNGDGIADMVVSSPDSLPGKTFVIFGRTSGSSVIDLSAINAAGVTTDGFTIDRGKVQAESIRLVGDINGDGIDDIAIDNVEPYWLDTFNTQRNARDQNTAPLKFATTATSNDATPAFVLYGRSTWDDIDTLALTSLAATDGTSLGGQVRGVGDFNGDGMNDMLFSSGQIRLGGGKGTITISGMPLAMVGEGFADVNGDGLGDVIVFNNQAGYMHSNTYTNANGGWWWNDAYVIYGNSAPTNINVTTLDSGNQSLGFHIRPNFNGGSADGLISSAAVAGDINGDGYADVMVSMTSGAGTSVDGIVRGETYVIYGGPTGSKNYAPTGGGFFSLQRALAPSEGFRINGACSGDAAGTFVSPAGDINGDGFDDLLVSARSADPHGVQASGTSYIVFGGRDDYTRYMVFQGSNGDLISSVGTNTNDVLTGTSVSNQIVAGDGDDVLIGNGGADVMYGGRGNDTFVINADNVTKLARTTNSPQDIARIDGGYGIDTVKIDGAGITLDMSAIPDVAIQSVEAFDLSGSGTNTLKITLNEVLQLGKLNNFSTANGYVAVAGQVPPDWSATNHQNQIKVDGNGDDYIKILDGQFSVVGRVTDTVTGKVYRVFQSAVSNAQILVSDSVLTQPVIDLTSGESADGLINVADRDSSGGTTIRVSIANTGAQVGDVLRLNYGGQDVDVTITAIPSDGYITVTVPTASLLAETPAGTSETVSMTAELMRSGASLIASNPASVDVNFIAPTAPTINNTAWAATGAGNTSDLSGIGEAKYEKDSATHLTSGTVDNGLYVSEVVNNGTLIRVQLPTTGAVPPVAGDRIVINWGSESYLVPTAITAANITAKYVDVTVPYSVINTQDFGNVSVTAQIRNAVGNLSATSPVTTVNWAYELPLAQISGGTQGFVINGSTSAGETGFSVASAGDVNGDGLEDVIIGARREDNNKGRAYVVFGKTDNTAIDLTAVLAGSGGFVISSLSKSDSYTGYDVYGAGDINGDGLADLLVSVPDFNSTTSGPGDVFVVYGKTGTAAVQLSTITGGQTTGFRISGVSASAQGQLGQSLAAAGDMNGDGIGDFIIAQPGQGKAYVVYGRQDNATIDITAVNNGIGGFAITGLTGGSNYWDANVGAGGDVNGDGLADVVIGDGNLNNTNNRAFVVFGSTNNPGSFVGTAVGTRGFIIQGATATGSKLGDHVTIVDDFNGDGLADVVVSDEARRVYVVYGKASNTTVALGASSVDATGAAGFTILTNDAADTVGSLMAKNVLVSSAGDFNGDGLTDLLIGVPTGDPYGRADAGRSYLVYGRTGGVSVSTGSMAFSDGFRIIGESAGDYSGFAISAAGDVNGDGFADLVMGAYGTDYGSQTFAGKSYVIFGGIDRVTKTSAIDFLGTSAGETLNGTNTTSGMNEQFIAGAGNDTLVGGGGADVMYGGAGNDTFVLNASNVSALARNTGNDSQNVARIDGGTGLDKIVLDGGGITLDLTAIRSEVIHNVEWLDVTGSGNNSVTLNLNNVVQMSNFNVYNTANGYAPVSTKEPAGWGAVNTDEQLLIDGNTGDAVTLKGAWYVSGQVAKAGVVYNVVQHVSATAQVLVHGDLDLHLQPAVDVGFGEIAGKLNLIEAQSDGETVVRVYIAYTGAVDGNALSLDWDGQTVVQAITATDIIKGYVDVAVSTATLLAATADGTSESIAVRADLLSAPTSGSLVVSGASAQVTVDFVRPTAPIIDATVWSSTNLTSDSTGIPEARYQLLTSASGTSFPTSGTADGQLTTSEVANGTVVRVQLPIGTGSAQPPVAGDTLVVGWGAFSKIIELTPAHITSKYVDVSLTATEVQSQPYGTVAVTAKLRSAATGNESNVAEVLVNYAFELPLGLVGNSVAGYAILGQSSLESGYHVAMLGDVNGDGLDDLLIGAPESTAPGGTGRSGQAYVVFGKTDNAAINLTAVAQGSGGFAIYGKSTGEFVGWDVSSVGDMNGDGLADLLVGATWNNGSGTYYAGRGYLIYGKSSGDAVYTSALGSQGFTIYGPAGPTSATRDNFANSVDMLGDVNGDGINDLGFFASNAGKAYVVYGKTDNSNILATAVEGGTGGFAMSGLASGIGFWGRIGGGGDINGDGYDDVVIGDAIFGSNDGRAFVVYGSSTGVNLAASSSLGTSGFVITGPTGQNFVMGMDVEILGDVNGDGLADVGVTAANRTAFVIYGGNSTNLTVSASAVDPSRGFAFSFNDPDNSAATYATNYYGQQLRLASIGDFNGDGLADFLVGYDKGDVYGTLDAGRGYVVYGRTSGQSISTSTMTASDGFRILGESASGYAGYGVAGGGDVNGDGFSDLVISAYGQFGTGTSGGKTYVVFGGLSGGTDPSQIDFMGTSAGETLNGTNTTSGMNEQFIAGAGNDTLVGGGGADVMYGGAGNDTFKLGADNVAKLDDAGTSQSIARIDGGTGLDKIVLDGSGITMDLTAIKTDVISNIEQIDISGSGANTVKLNLSDVLDMGSSNLFDVNTAAIDTRKQLMITADGNTDKVILTDLNNWTQATGGSATFAQDGHTYAVYNHNTSQVQLLIDQLATLSSS